MRVNLFNAWYNGLLTLALAAGIVLVLGPGLRWVVWTAHWKAVMVNLRLFMVGLYPTEQLWRPGVLLIFVALLFGGSASHGKGVIRYTAAILFTLLVLLTLLPIGQARLFVGLAWLCLAMGFGLGRRFRVSGLIWGIGWLLSLPIVLVVLGGLDSAGLSRISTARWGGLMLTVLLAFVSIVASFPLGVLLALGRQSTLPVIRLFSIAYIELVRGVPLVSVLMMFALLLPLFLPAGLGRPDMLLRAMVGMILFTAAYVAENVRGGLQAIPKGQYEAATALGLTWGQSMRYIILPQALRAVIPALVGQFIALFKDTSLVTIVGLLELLGIAKSVIEQPQWKTIAGGIVFEVFIFTALIYFVFAYNMSLASRRLEKTLGVGMR
jgi:general L-amino acid transport system permease protein